MDNQGRLSLKLQGLLKLHPEIIDNSILPRLSNLDSKDVVQATNHDGWFCKNENDEYQEVYINELRKDFQVFIAGKLAVWHCSFREAEEQAKNAISENPEYCEMYRLAVIELSGDSKLNIYYFMGSAVPIKPIYK